MIAVVWRKEPFRDWYPVERVKLFEDDEIETARDYAGHLSCDPKNTLVLLFADEVRSWVRDAVKMQRRDHEL